MSDPLEGWAWYSRAIVAGAVCMAVFSIIYTPLIISRQLDRIIKLLERIANRDR